ncbi:MAG: hypothetical protein ACREC5_02675, partial [Thermoplasmata archaeon]
NALVRSAGLDHDVESSPGLVVGPIDPVDRLRRAGSEPGAFWLTESGRPIQEREPVPEGFTAILSDPTDPTPEEVELLRRTGVPRFRVGPRSLRSSQVVDLVHHQFDLTEGAGTAPAGSGASPLPGGEGQEGVAHRAGPQPSDDGG